MVVRKKAAPKVVASRVVLEKELVRENDHLSERMQDQTYEQAQKHEVEVNESLHVVLPRRSSRVRRARLVLGGFVIVLVALVGVAYYFHWFGFGLSAEARNLREQAELQAAVSKLIIMQTDEAPVIAKVNDASAVRSSQNFYKDVEDGDVLLIYNTAQRAILYRPSKNRLVNVGPVYIDDKKDVAQ